VLVTLPRTLVVTNDFPPRPGGIEQFLANLLAHLDPGCLRVLTSHWPRDAEYDSSLLYRVDRVGRRPLLPTGRLLRAIERAADEHDAEVVVFGASWPLGELAALIDRPTFAFTYGHEAGLAQFGLGPLLRRVARGVDAVGVISGFTRHALEPWMAGHTSIAELPPGVDATLFHPDVECGFVRGRHGIDPEQPLVVCVSRLVRRKGQDALIEAWPAVRAQVPDAHLLLVGSGPLEEKLRARRRTLDLESAITIAGEVPWTELPAHYAAADLFAMPCRTRLGGLDVEGLGIVYLEAQACGTAVLAGRSGGAPEALIGGVTGMVVDGGAVPAVGAGIVELLRDRDRLRGMGRAGRRLVERRHDWATVAGRLVEILAKITLEPEETTSWPT
jgi:phosphatidyl-myo-inositol dimannoside synthase